MEIESAKGRESAQKSKDADKSNRAVKELCAKLCMMPVKTVSVDC